ncbi:MAG TPA: hypothetical protein PKC43_08175 [Phycisphaerales bacterium]|nr:hypothetical protein [Phycisphaerales bacterium]HMP37413.1 hypothetical protein [Phycisphaerales bacterium]
MRATIVERAPAKVNLALSVGPPGVDRMHPIASWMVTVDLHDELLLTQLPEPSFSRYAILWHPEARRRSEIDWSITRDLAVRAHLALEEHVGRQLPLQLKLEKRIPVGGGLGGGSSNAAAMLRGVNALFGLGLTRAELAQIGASLGSDVPFLVHGGSAMVEGLGERIALLPPPPPLALTLIFPEAPCPTGKVYAIFDELGPAGLRSEGVRALSAALRVDPSSPFNDLLPAALQVAPTLEDDIAEIAAVAERPVHLSGSGSTLFVVCDDPLHAEALASTITARLDLPAVAVRATG